MEIPKECRYTKDHEWVQPQPDGTVKVGITDYAQTELGDVVFVDLPSVGASLTKGKSFCTVESVKAVSDVYAPVDGTVVAVNSALADGPDAINKAPHTDGWMIALKPADPAQLNGMMDAAAYGALLKEIAK